MTLIQRLMAKVRIEPEEDGCWIWIGFMNDKVPAFNENLSVRRVLYEAETGEAVPADKRMTYTCDDHRCVKPGHLKVVTTKQLHVIAKQRRGALVRSHLTRAKIAAAKRAKSRIDMSIARRIREDQATHAAIAAREGISKSMVGLIKRNELWRDPPTSSLALIAQQAGML